MTPQPYGGILPGILLFDLSFVLGEVMHSQCSWMFFDSAGPTIRTCTK